MGLTRQANAQTTGCAGAEPERWAGYRRHTVARSTGTLVVLVDGYEQGIATPDDGDGRWFLICDPHGSLLSGDVQRDLRRHMCCPEEWCEGCREALDERSAEVAGNSALLM